jgi:tetratricopeptide (TPR) repeat protein
MLHLSLAEVAGAKYSTSMISQVERNRVDPSTVCLQYLSLQLKLPLDELVVLARQQRESETEAGIYKDYEERYAEIKRLLEHQQAAQALACFADLKPEKLPMFLRWRALALRGQSYFDLRKFSEAQRDFQAALAMMPASLLPEYALEAVRMRLHLASATRELNQLPLAEEYYTLALAAMDAATPLRYIAEAHWGFALVFYCKGLEQAQTTQRAPQRQTSTNSATFLQDAWNHADSARLLYMSIADHLNAALLQCQIAQIELAQGPGKHEKIESARTRLQSILRFWQPTLSDDFQQANGGRVSSCPERANVVSAAACYLASLELQASELTLALEHIHLAILSAKESNKVREAEAYMTQGRILEAQHGSGTIPNKEIETAYRNAVDAVKHTTWRHAQIQTHYQLGCYLMSTRRPVEGKQELDKANELAGISRISTIWWEALEIERGQ